MRNNFAITAALVMSLLMVFATASAQEQAMFAPAVEVSDQVSVDGTVTIDSVTAEQAGWMVIHADDGEGAPGPVIGFRQVPRGANTDVVVDIDTEAATPTLFAMLHFDTGDEGVYEFGTVEGADVPVMVDGNVVNVGFNIHLIAAQPQLVDSDTVNVPVGIVQDNGWMVVHADNGEGAPGAVLGSTYLPAGVSTNIPVPLDPEVEVTSVLYPMLHTDTGETESYEFGAVEGADLPIVVNDVLAVGSFSTVPAVNAQQQIVFDTFVADEVLSDGPGWLVVHAAAEGGGPGEVIGAEFVNDGYNADVAVSLNTDADFGSVIYPMLHEDTGEEGTYEFGEVDGVDLPVSVDGEVLTFPMLIRPSITANTTQSLEGSELNVVRIDNALIDAAGWMVIHADNGEGAPGEVIGFAPLLSGLNQNVSVLMDGDITETVYAMLHYDTNEIGEYEFGSVSGADVPVQVDDVVVTQAITLEGVE